MVKKFSKLIAIITILATMILAGCAATQPNVAPAKPEAKKEDAGQIKKLVEDAKFQIVDYDYVKGKVGDGLRKFNQVVIIDARPDRMYATAHIPGSINIPDTQIDKYIPQIEKFKIAKDTEIITYCGGFACIKSYNVAKYLRDKGFVNVKVYLAGDPEYSQKSFMEVSTSYAEKLLSEGAIFVDARPELVYKKGTLPTSVNVPDTKFVQNQDKYMPLLPTDKNKTLVVFCGGYACVKSHIVADILYAKGYKKTVVYAGGEPEWKEMGKQIVIPGQEVAVAKKADTVATSGGAVKAGKDEGTVDKEFFKTLIDSRADSIVVIDVRTPSEYQNGHVKGSINIPVDDMYKKDKGCGFVTSKLPKGKNIIFMCATGARAGEMWFGLKDDCKYDMKNIYFLDAKIDYTSGKCDVK